jgi:tetratricopeptide (TPR) repeat protein
VATVGRVVHDTSSSGLDALRLNLLDALYAADWTSSPGTMASSLWRDLACLLLARGDKDRAIEVASRIDGPYDIVGMRADARFRPLLHYRGVSGDVHAAMHARLERLDRLVKANPRSLRMLNSLLRELLATGDLSQVLGLSDPAISQDAVRQYDDLKHELNWTLDTRARALVRLDRSEEAVAELRRATALPDLDDKVSQRINLAALLGELGRAEESLAALPNQSAGAASERVSPYGLMQVARVRLSAALELQHTAEAADALAYLRAHRSDGISTLQTALVMAGEEGEAAEVLIARLHDTSERTAALVEIQTYASSLLPPLAARWHRSELELLARPDVQSAVHQVGSIASYPWLAAP